MTNVEVDFVGDFGALGSFSCTEESQESDQEKSEDGSAKHVEFGEGCKER